MSTSKQRITISMEPELAACVEEYQFSKKCKNTSVAIRELLEKGLAVSKGPDVSAAPSSNAMQLAAVYDRLDVYGQVALRETADREQKRMEAQQGPVRRPVAARNGTEPLDLSTLQPISPDEVDRTKLDL